LTGRTFKKHSTLEAAVHRDLVKTGLWPRQLGEGFSQLVHLRQLGDYSVADHVSHEQAEGAIQAADNILRAVANDHPAEFKGLFET
jgi:uncharacterized protein (UPF0332 family)